MSKPPEDDAEAAGARDELLHLSRGYVLSRAIHAAAELGVADHVGDRAVHVRDLARSTSCEPAHLERLMRLLAAHGVFSEATPGEFVATPLSLLLRDDTPGSLRPAMQMVNDAWWAAVGDLAQTVKTGEPAFGVRQGRSFFTYLKEHPDDQARFDGGMATNSRASDEAIARAYDFTGASHVLDVGGGRGGLVRAIVERHPHVRGTLFDQPQVVERAILPREGPLADRCATLAGDFFEGVPAGADVYLIKGVLHDFDDDKSAVILERCRRALSAGGKLLIIERSISPDNRPHQAKTIDLMMMTLLGGRERSHADWLELLRRTGLRLTRRIPTDSEFTIFEVVGA